MLTDPRDAFRGQSRSPNMLPIDVLCMVSYWCAVVSLFLGRAGFDIFDVKKTLKYGSEVPQGL